MKKINILIVLGLFVLLVGAVQPAYAAMLGSWVPTIGTVRGSSAASPENNFLIRDLAQLNSAASKFEGLLNSYSANRVGGEHMPWADDYWSPSGHLLSAVSDLSNSLEQFNTALMEVYPTLSEEEQFAVREAYSSLGLYLEDLAVRTNAIFGKEVFRIEYGEPNSSLNIGARSMNVLKSEYGDLN